MAGRCCHFSRAQQLGLSLASPLGRSPKVETMQICLERLVWLLLS